MVKIEGAWEIPQELWGHSITNIHCSARTINALLRSRYLTLGQLNKVQPNRIAKLRNIGQHGLEELHAEIQRIVAMGKSDLSKEFEVLDPEIHISANLSKDAIQLRQDRDTQTFLEKRFPDLPKIILVPEKWGQIALEKSELDLRTINALQRNRFKNLSDLNALPTYALFRLRGIGIHSVVRFMRQLEVLFAGPGPEPWQLRKQEHLETTEIPESIEEVLTIVRRKNLMNDDRLVFVISARFGLLGQERMTLQQIGDSLNLSRERVRQLEKVGLRRLFTARGTSNWGGISTAPEWSLMLRAIDKARLR